MGQRARRWAVAAAAIAMALPATLATAAGTAAASTRPVAHGLTATTGIARTPSAVALDARRTQELVLRRVAPTPAVRVAEVAAGHAHGCAVLASSGVECWGWNAFGQLGNGTTTSSTHPVVVRGLRGVAQVALGFAHTCALLRGGIVRCWGWNGDGQLGDRSLRSSLHPVTVLGLAHVRELAVGFAHACALVATGAVRCWGWNAAGQLGDRTTSSRWVPVPVRGLGSVLQVSAGYSTTCAVLRSRHVACWGANASGELGDGSYRSTTAPVLVRGLAHVRSVAVGFSSVCAVLTTGRVECWGKNNYGQLGDGGLRNRPLPTTARRLAHVVQLALGFGHTCALLVAGTIRCWGWNGHGQLGTGNRRSHLVAVPSAPLLHVIGLTAGDDDTCALLRLGLVSCWGWNSEGELGDGTTAQTVRPPYLPAAPRVSVSRVGNAQVRVRWMAPRTRGVAAITGYTATATDTTMRSHGGQSCSWASGPLTCTVAGLTNGDAYTFAVDAHNAVGRGPWSAPSPAVTPATIPDPPRDVTAFAANHGAELVWATPVTDGGRAVTRYVATATDVTTPSDGGETCVWTAGPLDCTVHGLTNGDAYTFTVFARNRLGPGAASHSNAVVPAAVPDAPPGVDATAGSTSALVAWSASVTNGSAVTKYVVTATDATSVGNGGQTCTWTSGPLDCTVTGLTNGDDYTFGVAATNVVGSGPPGLSLAVIPATVPDAPSGISGTRGDSSVLVTWTAPGSDGGRAVTGYTVTATDQTNGANGGETCSWSSGPLSCSVTGLTNGDAYTFVVFASNPVGSGAASAPSGAVTPATVPGAPTSVHAVAASASATVSWTPGTDGGSTIDGYTVTATDVTNGADSGATCSWTTGPLSCAVPGLNDGDSYTFTVTAHNAVGTGAASSPSGAVTPADVPGSPRSVSASAGAGAASVTWSAPSSDGGSTITGYKATASDQTNAGNSGQTCIWSTGALTCTVHGLTNGDAYTFTVTATNGVGTGASSSPSSAVTPTTVPDAPTSVSAVAGEGSASVGWSAPDTDGGSAITAYTVTASDQTNSLNGGETCDWPGGALTCTVEGLTSGDSYTFTVSAGNADGTGASSTSSNEVTVPTTPDAPSGVLAVPAVASAVVGWNAPDTDGGSTIFDYTVTATDQTTSANGGETCDWSNGPLSCTVAGLTTGDSYTFTVTATNEVGSSSPSDPSPPVVAL